MPFFLLGAAWLALPHLGYVKHAVPKTFSYLPYIIFSLGIVLSLRFNLTRIAFVLLTFCLAYWGYRAVLVDGQSSFESKVVFHMLCLLLPLNIALFAFMKERGITTFQGGIRLGLILFQIIFTLWIIRDGRQEIYQLLSKDFFSSNLGSYPLPQSALIMNGLALLLLSITYYLNRSSLETGLMGALVAANLACFFVGSESVFILFISAAGLILIVGIIQNTHHMAYRDELTGLLARRALNERTLMLGRRYTVAMLDVDHFKKFNDTYGHDTGDHVLKMVAGLMQKVGGGGRPYRYGGEEFTILFPGKDLESAMSHLETLRERIATYNLGIRGKNRPNKSSKGKRGRGSTVKDKSVSVTISIGVAESSGKKVSPVKMISEADKALYRAKKKGRNRVSV
ncbi:MAG: GGDEF domain-containing protein [Proteobacteria bacterium]|nr:GGDEF domain-containing protein [Pseudomonadota bacterium]